jgi:hypothetical protein
LGHDRHHHFADLLIRDAQEIGKMINGLVRSLERSQY